jgi:uncharacterized DUF497 family protein
MSAEFDCDEANLSHIAAHEVSAEEAEQVLNNDPLELDVQHVQGEERFPAVGVTNNGRFLVVIVTERNQKVRVVTAYPADNRVIAIYLKSRFERL